MGKQKGQKAGQNFIKLKKDEVHLLFEHAKKVLLPVTLWTKDKSKNILNFNSYTENEEKKIFSITVDMNKTENLTKEIEGEDVYLYFIFENVDHFVKGRIEEIIEEKQVSLLLKSEVFRLEQRKKDRVKTYPGHEVYIFFPLNYEASGPSNLVLLNKPKDDLMEFFRKFQGKLYRSIVSPEYEMEDKELSNIIAFRVLDVSNHGASFLINSIEKSFLSAAPKNLTAFLSINGRKIEIKNANVVHTKAYNDPKAPSVSLYKVGLNFEENATIVAELKEPKFDGSVNIETFEDFIES